VAHVKQTIETLGSYMKLNVNRSAHRINYTLTLLNPSVCQCRKGLEKHFCSLTMPSTSRIIMQHLAH